MKKFALGLLLVVATGWWLKGALAPANEGITSGMYIDPVRDAQAVGDVVKDPRGWK